MANKRVISAVIFAVTDAVVSTVLFGHGGDYWYQFTSSLSPFSVYTSVFDLWCLSVVRTCFLLGCSIGVCRNPAEGPIRLKVIDPVVVTIGILMWAYPLVKLLLYNDVISDLHKPWLWSLLAWSFVAAVTFYVLFNLMSKIKISQVQGHPEAINSTSEEREPLTGNSTCDNECTSDKKMEKTEDEEGGKANISRLLKYSRHDLHYILIGFFFLLIASACEIFIPFYTGQVIDAIAIEKSEQKFTSAIIKMTVICIGSAIASGCRGGMFSLAIARLNIRIRNELFSCLVQQEIGFYDVTKTGDLTSRLTSDTTTMSEALGLNINIFLRNMVKTVGVCIFMFRLSWRLSLVTVIGLPIIMVVSEVYGKYYKALSEKVQDSLAKANEVADETCSTMRTVRSFANEGQEAQRYREKLGITFKLKVKESFAYAGYIWCEELFALSLVVATLYYGGHLVVHNVVTGGNLVSFILYQIELGYAIESIGGVYTGLMEAVGASAKVFKYIDRKPEIQNTGKLAPTKFKGKLEFQNVTFAYPSRPDTNVLQDVSFTVQPGEVVALVGPSGGGKSSCVKLLQHFYEAQGGQVLLDGKPIQDYDHKYLHQQISLVGQEPVLYARSIKENISYGLEVWTDDMVQHAAVLANAHQFITGMTDKYDTQTGEKGVQLSGGQKQRIAIARAFVRNPTVLLLDEATSALDAESEHVVQEAMYNNLKGRTVLIIAHRLSTVERAQRIIVLNKGKIAEQGTHQELLRHDGIYAQLVQRQLLAVNSTTLESGSKIEKIEDRAMQESATEYGSFKSLDTVISPGTSCDSYTYLRNKHSPTV